MSSNFVDTVASGVNTTTNTVASGLNNITNNLASGLNTVNSTVHSHMKVVSEHSIGKIILYMVIILYASLVAPKISTAFSPYINNMYFRIGFMSLIAWTFTKDPTLSILVAVCYYLTISYLTKNAMSHVEESGEMTESDADALAEAAPPAAIPAPIPAQVQQEDAVEEAAPLLTATGEVQVNVPDIVPEGLADGDITAAPVVA